MSRLRHISLGSVRYAGDSSALPDAAGHVVGSTNRWSRVTLTCPDVTSDIWCEFSFQIGAHPDEQAVGAPDFAAIGVDFLAADGSSIDFASVPGLSRLQIDPYSFFVAADSARDGRAGTAVARCTFLVPAPATQLLLTIRSWRNSHPFQVANVAVTQFVQRDAPDLTDEQPLIPSQDELRSIRDVRRNWRTMTPEPNWFSYAVVPEKTFYLRGQIINGDSTEGALARIVFRDAQNIELPQPYPDTLTTPETGAFLDIPAHGQARRFTLAITVPPQAMTVDVGFRTWRPGSEMKLVVPLEVSLDESLLLQNITAGEVTDALAFIERFTHNPALSKPAKPGENASNFFDLLLDRNSLAPTPLIHEKLRVIQRGRDRQFVSGRLHLDRYPGWPLPAEPNWTEDPFRSRVWRMEFHSLSWLLDIAKPSSSGALAQAIALALSWSRGNPLGEPADGIALHPLTMSTRAEVLAELLVLGLASKDQRGATDLLELAGELVRHCFAISEIISQNVFSSPIYQIHAAASLLSLARILPRLPLADHWSSVALACLRDSFDQLLGPGGQIFEPSQYYRFELIALGLILTDMLKNMPEGASLAWHLGPRLEKAALAILPLLDPSGFFPPFGETPRQFDHATALGTLICTYGQEWTSDPGIRKELSYPYGSRVLAFADAGIVAARHYEPGREWGYLCAAFSEQGQSHVHSHCTSFVYSSGGMPWIVDAGGSGENQTGTVRRYLTSSRAHNVVIPDGREQTAGVGWLRSSITLQGATAFEICSNVHGPDYLHRRILVCLDDLNAMAVFDDFRTIRDSLSVDGFLHFDPRVVVALANPRLAVGFQKQKRLRIVPHMIAGRFGGLEIANGVSGKSGVLQGFVAAEMERIEPANVLRYRMAGRRSVCGGVVVSLDESASKTMANLIASPALGELLKGQATVDERIVTVP